MADVLYGKHPVLEALKADQPLEKVFVQHGQTGRMFDEIARQARRRGIVVAEVPSGRLSELAPGVSHQGVVALVGSVRYAELPDLVALGSADNPTFLVLLDGIEDPHNLGAIIRTAEAAGAHGLVIPKHGAVGVTDVVHKTSAGATAYLPIARVTNLVHAMTELKAAGVWIVGTAGDEAASRPHTSVDYRGPIALVVGSEGSGMRRLVREGCDFLVSIPMRGQIESLNASVAAGVGLYEAVRQRLGGEPTKG